MCALRLEPHGVAEWVTMSFDIAGEVAPSLATIRARQGFFVPILAWIQMSVVATCMERRNAKRSASVEGARKQVAKGAT